MTLYFISLSSIIFRISLRSDGTSPSCLAAYCEKQIRRLAIMAKDLSTMAKNNKSYMAKPGEVESKWYIVDATDMVLGRLASQVATVLKGKNKPEYTPNVDCGDHVIIINCDKVILTGNKLEDKYYRYHTGYVGGLKEIQYKKLMKENPDKAVMKAVKGMLPKNSLGAKMLKKLRVYAGSEHNHSAQCPVELKLK